MGENFLTSLILFDSPKCNVLYSFKGFGVVFLIFHPKAPKNCSGQRRGGGTENDKRSLREAEQFSFFIFSESMATVKEDDKKILLR